MNLTTTATGAGPGEPRSDWRCWARWARCWPGLSSFLLGNAAGSTAEAAREAPCLPGQPVDIMDSPHVSSEHGHVVIQYAPATSIHEITQLERLARRYGSDVLLAPYPKVDDGIALTAWGRIDLLEQYDQGRVTAFVEALRGRYRHGWTTNHDCP